jgi:hypothetical protein
VRDGLTKERLNLQKSCLGSEAGVTPRLNCTEREDEDGGKADHQLVGEFIVTSGRVG